MFVKIDLSLNDVEGLKIDSYPTFFLYPKNLKEYPIKYTN